MKMNTAVTNGMDITYANIPEGYRPSKNMDTFGMVGINGNIRFCVAKIFSSTQNYAYVGHNLSSNIASGAVLSFYLEYFID